MVRRAVLLALIGVFATCAIAISFTFNRKEKVQIHEGKMNRVAYMKNIQDIETKKDAKKRILYNNQEQVEAKEDSSTFIQNINGTIYNFIPAKKNYNNDLSWTIKLGK